MSIAERVLLCSSNKLALAFCKTSIAPTLKRVKVANVGIIMYICNSNFAKRQNWCVKPTF